MKGIDKLILLSATVLTSGTALAEEAASVAAPAVQHGAAGMAVGWISIAAGLAIGISVLGGALGQGRAATAALDGIARNPAASGKLFLPLILSLALIESLVIYALVIAFSLNTQITNLIGLLGGPK